MPLSARGVPSIQSGSKPSGQSHFHFGDVAGSEENASDSSPNELLSIGSRDEQLVSAEKPRATFVKEDIRFRR